MDKEKEKIMTILRSLIISCNPQDGMHLNELLADFKKFEGHHLPLFEYKTAVEFLLASGAFEIKTNARGVIIVYAKTTATSKHVSKLVCETNRTRARRLMHPPNQISTSVQNRISWCRAKNVPSVFNKTEQRAGGIVYSQQQNVSRLPPPHLRTGIQTKEFSFEQLKDYSVGEKLEKSVRPVPVVSLEQLKSALKEVSQLSSELKDEQRNDEPTTQAILDQVKTEPKESTDDQRCKDQPSIKVSMEKVKVEPKQCDDGLQYTKRTPSTENCNFKIEKVDEANHLSVSLELVETHQQSTLIQTEKKVPDVRTDVFAVICADDADASIEYQHMTKLELPWSDEYWSVLITSCTSTTAVWGRLNGKHSRFDPSAIEFQGDILANRRNTTMFNVGHIYLTIVSGMGHRIRVDNVDDSTKQILCFFIDSGYKKWIEMNEIYNCTSLSMNNPPQAIRFSLNGLECLPIRNARKCLEKTLLNQTVTVQVVTMEDDFLLANKSNDTEAVIQAALYDTSNGNYVNLHREIVQQMYEDIAPPELTTSKLTPVIVTHIADNGDIYCQLQTNGVHYLNKLINEFVRQVSNNPFLPAEKIVQMSNEHFFVVYDPDTTELYRAKMIRETVHGMKMFLVDYGRTITVCTSMMYCVECPDHEISKFPPQAIRIKLSGVSKGAVERSVSKLRDRFTLKRYAYVKSMQPNTNVPDVKLYFDVDTFLVCINDSIELETERNQLIATSQHHLDDVTVSKEICPRSQARSGNFSIETVKYWEWSTLGVARRPTIETFQPPKLNCRFEVMIVQSESPSHFVIKPIEYIAQWQTQMKALQIHCKASPETLSLDMIVEGEPYACLKTNGYWYRAHIKFHRSKMFAFFCDIADIDNISDVSKIKFLPMEFRIIPKLAMTARLYGIKPIKGTWDLDDKVQFHRITKGKKFDAIVAKIMYNEKKHDNSMLAVKLEYKSNVINDLFVQSERAVYTLESEDE